MGLKKKKKENFLQEPVSAEIKSFCYKQTSNFSSVHTFLINNSPLKLMKHLILAIILTCSNDSESTIEKNNDPFHVPKIPSNQTNPKFTEAAHEKIH